MEKESKIKQIITTYGKIKGKTYDEVISEMKNKFPNLKGNAFCRAVLTEIRDDKRVFDFVDKVLALEEIGKNVEIVPAPVVEAELKKHIIITPNAQKMLDEIKKEYDGEKK